ncbi:hypothetical protein EDB80DRAFT_880259 [Ilyonectria destructans]|nr:hypothetical protein EDB80DRAFT_880259 [Ilyonectria destructans]
MDRLLHQQRITFGTLYDTFPTDSRVFENRSFLAGLGNRILKRKIADEKTPGETDPITFAQPQAVRSWFWQPCDSQRPDPDLGTRPYCGDQSLFWGPALTGTSPYFGVQVLLGMGSAQPARLRAWVSPEAHPNCLSCLPLLVRMA